MIVVYARVSTDAQIEAGLVSQLAELRRYAKEKYAGEESVEVVDDGYSGADVERPGLEKLRALVRERRVRVVLACDPDRLSRDAAHLLLLMKEIEKGGATLDFVRGGFEQSDSGRMLLQMRGVIAEYERAQIGLERNVGAWKQHGAASTTAGFRWATSVRTAAWGSTRRRQPLCGASLGWWLKACPCEKSLRS
jgi:site-specific DNA recombinase